jgi:FixJ family two-component response regulator
MPGGSGINLHKQLTNKGSNIPVIFLTAHGDLPMGVQAIKSGAEEFLQKPVDEFVLLEAVRKALIKCQSANTEQIRAAKIETALNTLTPRELEILQFILGGATNKQIANFFHISEKTIKVHRGKIMQKTGATSAAELGWIGSFANITVKKV